MIIGMLIVFGLFAALLITVIVVGLYAIPQDVQDVFCFLFLLAICVGIVVSVIALKGV